MRVNMKLYEMLYCLSAAVICHMRYTLNGLSVSFCIHLCAVRYMLMHLRMDTNVKIEKMVYI